jgi:hypothetical protein
MRKWLHTSSDFTSTEKAKVQGFPLLNHEVIMGNANKKDKQLYQQLHLFSTVDRSCIYYLRQGRTNSRVQVATAS